MRWFQNGFAKIRIIETTKRSIAVDSIIARPTNKVRVIVDGGVGLLRQRGQRSCNSAALLPSAGPMVPKPVVMPAMTIDATEIIVILSPWLSICCPSSCFNPLHRVPGLGLRTPRRGRDVNRCEDAEDVGLHHAREQTERCHDDRKEERRDGEQDPDNYHRPAHHIPE